MDSLKIPPVLAWFTTAASLLAADAAPIDVGDRRQRFLDNLFFGEPRGISLRMHQPRKAGDVTITTDRPWERGGLGPYSSMLWDNGRYGDCDIIHTANEINRTVTCRGSPELPTTGVVRLRIEMRNTDLYAFQFSAN